MHVRRREIPSKLTACADRKRRGLGRDTAQRERREAVNPDREAVDKEAEHGRNALSLASFMYVKEEATDRAVYLCEEGTTRHCAPSSQGDLS